MHPITSYTVFRDSLLAAIGYSLQFGRIPQSLYPRYNWDGTYTTYYPYARIQRVLDMATKKPGKNRTPFGNVEFINYKFDKESKSAFDKWFNEKGDTVIKGIFQTLQDDNKMSVSYDQQNECFIASMTGKDESLNKGKCITIRSSEWFRALAALAFVHVVLFDGEIWTVSGETDLV